MTKVLIVIDEYGWAFNNIANQIKKRSNTEVDICSIHDLKSVEKYNHTVLMFYSNEFMKLLDRAKKVPKMKTTICIYDYTVWTTDQRLKVNLMNMITRCDNVLVACQKIYDMLTKLCPNKTLRFCEDGVDPDLFPFNNNPIRVGKLRIGWTGSSKYAGVQKGINEIRTVVSRLDFCELIVQDGGFDKKVPLDKMFEFYKKIDVYVCFSSGEGTPNPILEASCSGVCWVSTDVGIVRRLYETCDDKPGIIIEKNVDRLRETLIYLNNNRELVRKMGENGRNAILKKWTWQDKAKQFTEIF